MADRFSSLWWITPSGVGQLGPQVSAGQSRRLLRSWKRCLLAFCRDRRSPGAPHSGRSMWKSVPKVEAGWEQKEM